MESPPQFQLPGDPYPLLEDLLLPPSLDLRLHAITIDDDAIRLTVIATAPEAHCPLCGVPAAAIHSHYLRRVADLPLVGLCVQLRLEVRKFFCRNPECRRKIFSERLAPFLPVYARRTRRLRAALEELALQQGGEAGAREATKQGMPVSPDSLLRWMRALPESPVQAPRILSIDDWARRKGQRYGTIVVDLETHQPIDLLPDREADTVAAWLEQHPGIEIISRDRGGAYAEAAERGAPHAQQVADRFHLLQNLREAVQRLMDRQQTVLRQVTRSSKPTERAKEPLSAEVKSSPTTEMGRIDKVPTRDQQRRQLSRAHRQARYAEVKQLHPAGWSRRAIARKLKMSRHTVRRFLDTDVFPERARPVHQSSILNHYVSYLTRQMQAGQTNGMRLWRDLCAQGYRGSRSLVSLWVARHRFLSPVVAPSPEHRRTRGRPPTTNPSEAAEPIRPLSPKQASWLVFRPPEDLDDDQQDNLQRLRRLSSDVETIYPLVQEFGHMVRTRAAQSFESWLQPVRDSKVRELLSFAKSLERDKSAVMAGLSLPYSNGQVEGQITRLKLIKRSMYGRANFDLLRRRVLLADTS